ncbi:MAG: flagellar protein FlaG [Desulfobacterales bacterium]|nr:flagellar protein FlaG [Desulfobacterales bacterium]
MKIEAIALAGAGLKVEQPAAEKIDEQRKAPELSVAGPEQDRSKVAPEEILSKIKDLTEDGVYSIRFEMNKEIEKLIIKVVDKESGELIRQIPPEELITASERMRDYRGLIIETES